MKKKALPEVRVTTFIRATPARVWKALTDPKELVRWYLKPEKLQLKKGGRWDFIKGNLSGKVLKVENGKKEKRLVHSFRFNFIKGEPESLVTFVVEPRGKDTKLTLIHSRFGTAKQTRGHVSGGWPFLIANLKTFLETLKPLQEGGYSGCG